MIQQSSAVFLKKRRFYTVLPLLICPFLILFFWLLGGGTAVASTPAPHTVGGLNLTLPAAKLKDISHLTKLDYYRQADQDSAKHRQLAKNDPYCRLPGLPGSTEAAAQIEESNATPTAIRVQPRHLALIPRSHDSDRNEAMVYRKLAALNTLLEKRAPATPPATLPTVSSAPVSPEVTRLEHLMQTLHTRDTSVDPDLQQLSGLLDRIKEIEHGGAASMVAGSVPSVERPNGLATQLPVVRSSDSVAAVSLATPDSTVAASEDENGFLPEDSAGEASAVSNAIAAVVDEPVSAVNGTVVPFRLLSDIRVKGEVVPTGSLVYGTVQISGDRLAIAIRSVQYHQNIYSVSLTVYSTDGLAGIPAPSSVERDVAKQSADASIQSMGLTSFDPSIGAQATVAGIQAAKTFLSKKVRLVTVKIPAGYQVFLKTSHI